MACRMYVCPLLHSTLRTPLKEVPGCGNFPTRPQHQSQYAIASSCPQNEKKGMNNRRANRLRKIRGEGIRKANLNSAKAILPIGSSNLHHPLTSQLLIIITPIIRSIAFLAPMRNQRLPNLIQFDKLAPDGVVERQHRLMLFRALDALLGEGGGSGRY